MSVRTKSWIVIDSHFKASDSYAFTYSLPFTVTNSGKLDSQGNPGYRNLSARKGDVGSGFLMERSEFSTSMRNVSLTGANGSIFQGTQLPCPAGTVSNGLSLPTFGVSQQNALLAMGTTAIAQTLPTNPSSGVLNFAGELYRDGIPSIVGSGLIKSRLKDYRELGSEYLNVEFGWKPFVNDLRKILYSVQNSEKILAQAKHDSMLFIHRRYDFPSYQSTETTTTLGAGAWPGGGVGGYGKPFFQGHTAQGRLDLITTKNVETWFEGCYQFYYPLGDSQIDRMKRFSFEANKLLGLRLTPEVLWNLTPWTWLGDWVSNFGDIIHNVSSLGQDNLVMKYGYIMQHTKYQRDARMALTWPRSDGTGMYDLTFINERKVRMKASPYGFGLTWNGFSPRQWAILGAIGISNGRKTSM